MKRQLITLLCAVCALAASAQTTETRYLRIHQLDGYVVKVAINSIDSIEISTNPTYTVTLSANDKTIGTVTGAGAYEEGDTAILTATAKDGYAFYAWSDGEKENPRALTVTSDTTLTAIFYGIHNDHYYVDLGLPSGLLWATCNVGATAPEEYGDYFAWGETTTKDTYSDSSYKYSSNPTTLPLANDAARANWGGDWRMPTRAEFDELLSSCTWTWTSSYNGIGRAGYIVKSKVTGNTNSIFLPAAGCRTGASLIDAGTGGIYWSSSYKSSSDAWYLYFTSSNRLTRYFYRYYGRSVRPVCSAK